MEIILAIVVASAVIFFGALISMGNEHQRRAIDGLREQVVLWAVQDLRIKRESLGRGVQVENPLEWLNVIASKLTGLKFDLEPNKFMDGDIALVCTSRDDHRTIAFSQFSPSEVRKISKKKRNRLSQMDRQNDLMDLLLRSTAFEASILSFGVFFDLELQIAWKMITKQVFNGKGALWVYAEL